jgi:hypothetical protein
MEVVIDPSASPVVVTAIEMYVPGAGRGFTTARWDRETRAFTVDPRWWPYDTLGVSVAWRATGRRAAL